MKRIFLKFYFENRALRVREALRAGSAMQNVGERLEKAEKRVESLHHELESSRIEW